MNVQLEDLLPWCFFLIGALVAAGLVLLYIEIPFSRSRQPRQRRSTPLFPSPLTGSKNDPYLDVFARYLGEDQPSERRKR